MSEKILKKPPIGLVPKGIHDSKRCLEIVEAIIRYDQDDIKIPEDWLLELHRTIGGLHVST